MNLAALLLLALLPLPALADPVTLIVGALYGLGYIGGYVAFGLLAANAVYGAADARRKARNAQAAARDAYNASLQDRTATLLQAAPPWRVVYGRCRSGGDIVAEFTTDKTTLSNGANIISGGTLSRTTKPDAYKHLVIVVAAHEVEAIHEVYLNGIPVGAVDGNGWATGGPTDAPWGKPQREVTQVTSTFAGGVATVSVPVGYTATKVLLVWQGGGSNRDGPIKTTPAPGTTTITAGGVVTNSAGISGAWKIQYEYSAANSSVRWTAHLGTDTQTADPFLVALFAGLPGPFAFWTANHRLQGLAYAVLTLDLEDSRFTGGPPQIDFDISGRLVLDPRTATTAWSANNALCTYDWLRAPWGFGVSAADIDTASANTAATDCETAITLTVGATVTTGQPLYTCSGAFNTAAAKEAVLEDLCNSMAGLASGGALWRIQAGVWTSPVMDLTDDDAHGPVQIVQAAAGEDDAVNSLRATYIPAGEAAPIDAQPYLGTTYVAADGEELWDDVALPFTDNKARCRNLQRIRVEANRAGLVVQYPASLRAWPLQVGDRIRVSCADYTWTLKTFRVTDWQFDLRSAVMLTLQEDVATTWDLADAAVADPAPNTDAANPWAMPDPVSVAAATGTAQMLRLSDGTIQTRVLVTWAATTAAYMTGPGAHTEIRWAVSASDDWQTDRVLPGTLGYYIAAPDEGAALAIGVRHVNALGIGSDWKHVGIIAVGTSEAPADVADLAAINSDGDVTITWTPSTELDYAYTDLRHGAGYAFGTPIAQVAGSSWVWAGGGATPATVWAAHVDSSGNESIHPASAAVTAPPAPLAASAAVYTVQAGGAIKLGWAAATDPLRADFEIRIGASWGAGAFVARTTGVEYVLPPVSGAGDTYWIASRNRFGLYASAVSVAVAVAMPGAVVALRAVVVDNNVQLSWSPPVTGTQYLSQFEVRRGATWAGATLVGRNAASTFAVLFEQSAATYTYWVAGLDSAGNYGAPASVSVAVNQPPDYVLRLDFNSTWGGALTNAVLASGALVAPVNTAETWGQHFSSHSWSTPQDQITAGYPLYINPSLTTASYEEIIDYGSTLPATTIVAVLNSTVLSGSVTPSCQIKWSNTSSSGPWTSATAGATSALATVFRWVSVTWSFSASAGANLIRCDGANIKLFVKNRTDSGSGTAAVGGTTVSFGISPAFVAADTPIVQPLGSTPLVPVVIYSGGANPTSFVVKLYNLAGSDVGGSFSWSVRGY